jgi:SAM-dependent methyltransferase
MTPSARINQPGSVVGPLPASAPRNSITEVLARYACQPFGDEMRGYQVRIEQGLLIAPDTGRWYPIRDFIPELLPDYLRDFDRDREWLAAMRPALPEPVMDMLNAQTFPNAARKSQDSGISYKSAEMTLAEKVVDYSHFFGPGYIAPFNPGAGDHTLKLIRLFGICMPLLYNGTRRIILDSGCGYSWTTDWLWKSGFEPIGIDISRIYLDIANRRLGAELPYVLVGDTENLPIRDEVIDGVLGFDAFHHIPNRKRAMQEFYRSMKANGIVVLAEPPGEHEHVPAVQDVMKKYGTLEKGMELEDVRSYVKDTGLDEPVQHYIVDMLASDAGETLSPNLLKKRSFNPENLFTIEKRQSMFSRVRNAVSRTLTA